MCGIAGYTGLTQPGVLEDMAQRMIHRGPDGEGFYTHPSINLCMRRLAIVDLTTGEQPKFNRDRSVALVFNGEIYNYIELRSELETLGYVFESESSDTEVIVHLYEEYGVAFVSRLIGMFAIALYDHRLDELFLIRDRMGKKPLYYTHAGGGPLYFSSEFNTLLLDDRVAHIEPEAIQWFFSQKAMDVDQSVDDRVLKLPPGSYLKFSTHSQSLEIVKYWQIADSAGARKSKDSETTLTERFETLIADSVRLRMRADVEVGAFLSGGVDSSLIVALASAHTPKPLKTYCLTYSEEIYNKSSDRLFSREVAALFKTHHQEVLLTPTLLQDELPKIVKHIGEPNAAVISAWFISREMQKTLKVALSGDGADELFGSYFTHKIAAALRDLNTRPMPEVLQYLGSRETTFLKSLDQPSLSHIVDLCAVFSDLELKDLMAPKYYQAHWTLKRFSAVFSHCHASDPLDQMLEFDCHNLLVNQILNYSDVLGMAHSVEIRAPFLDHRIVDFAFSIDSHLKIENGVTKKILRSVAEKYLPAHILDRPKEGFIEPGAVWLRKELKAFCMSYLKSEHFNRLRYLNLSYVQNVLDRFYDSGDYFQGKKVWSLLMYAIWERHYGEI